jgi:hypothetical protein
MPSRDLLVAAHQQITREWWANRRFGFDLYVSELVLRECRAGDAVLAATRAEVIRELPLLRITNEALELADALVLEGPIPRAPRLTLSTCRLPRFTVANIFSPGIANIWQTPRFSGLRVYWRAARVGTSRLFARPRS